MSKSKLIQSVLPSALLPQDAFSANVNDDGFIVEDETSWSGYNVIDMDETSVIISMTEDISSPMAVRNIIEKVERETGKKVSTVTGLGEDFPYAELYHTVEEKIEQPVKKARAKVVKSPLFEMLPQVFKGNGKVKRHPINDKIKTVRAREIMRLSIRYASMSSVMVVLPVGVLSLSDDFKTACINSVGESIYDFVLEEMMMQGWTLRGIEITKNDEGDKSFSVVNSENA